MYRTPSILRLSVDRRERAKPVAAPPAPREPPVAECLNFIRLCRDGLLPLLDRSACATPKEFRILKVLRAERGDCAAAVSARLAIDDGEMSRLVTRLEAKGLLIRTKTEGRRKTALWLTPTGRALVDRINWAEHQVLEARLEGLTSAEQDTLRLSMAAVADLLCGADGK